MKTGDHGDTDSQGLVPRYADRRAQIGWEKEQVCSCMQSKELKHEEETEGSKEEECGWVGGKEVAVPKRTYKAKVISPAS